MVSIPPVPAEKDAPASGMLLKAGGHRPHRPGIAVTASLAVWLLGAYLVLVLPVDERLWPAINRPYAAVFTILATLAGIYTG
jgi:hypothetical protein